MTSTGWHLGAATLEAGGNTLLIVALAAVGRRPWPSIALKQLAAVTAVYAATNVFYSAAHIGRTLDVFDWWGTTAETVARTTQIGSMWAMLLAGIEAVVAARD